MPDVVLEAKGSIAYMVAIYLICYGLCLGFCLITIANGVSLCGGFLIHLPFVIIQLSCGFCVFLRLSQQITREWALF